MKGQVKIGPRFFSKAFNDYAVWQWALAREFMQNSIDCGSRTIAVTVKRHGEDTLLTVENDGEVMTQDILVNKLLAIGESGKDFDGSVGGFGLAKLILYMCHRSYQIYTGSLAVDGCGGDYELTETTPYQDGTKSVVVLAGDRVDEMLCYFNKFVTLCQWRGTFTLNGEVVDTRLNKGRGRTDLEFGRVYTNSDQEHLLVVRIDGMPMFTRYCAYKGCVVLELNGRSSEVLISSRDALKYKYNDQLNNFVTEIAVNKRSALREKVPQTERVKYDGYRIAGSPKPQKVSGVETVKVPIATKGAGNNGGKIQEKLQAALSRHAAPVANSGRTAADSTQEVVHGGNFGAGLVMRSVAAADVDAAVDAGGREEATLAAVVRPAFHLKNELGMKIPAWFLPDDFSDNSRSLISRWLMCLQKLADIYGITTPFSVGFIFSDDREAEYEPTVVDGETERIFYINPALKVQQPGKSSVLKVRWKLDNVGVWDLVATAVHEFVHFMGGVMTHDEDYALLLTEVAGKVLQYRSEFAKIFQAPLVWAK